MGTRFRFLPGLLVPVFLLGLNACKTSSSTTSSGTGALFVSTQGDSLVSAYTINLATGVLTANGAGVATGTIPSAMLLAPSGSALFIVNSNPAITPTVPPTPCTLPDNPGSISAYTVKSDGTLSPASGSHSLGYGDRFGRPLPVRGQSRSAVQTGFRHHLRILDSRYDSHEGRVRCSSGGPFRSQ